MRAFRGQGAAEVAAAGWYRHVHLNAAGAIGGGPNDTKRRMVVTAEPASGPGAVGTRVPGAPDKWCGALRPAIQGCMAGHSWTQGQPLPPPCRVYPARILRFMRHATGIKERVPRTALDRRLPRSATIGQHRIWAAMEPTSGPIMDSSRVTHE